ncbi:hypothetical protein WJX72_004047 [[Myrmecia] bisecta]|uniref:RING-type domain-containing protein n=1 Tax=[Myrmecia] bisecta TaxID=41462 RepID=A0AAW1PSJ7_9CHLO
MNLCACKTLFFENTGSDPQGPSAQRLTQKPAPMHSRVVVLNAVGELDFPILCPLCKAGQCGCAKCGQSANVASSDSAGEAYVECCSLDADVAMLLTPKEQGDYEQKTLKAAAHRTADLVLCPRPDCEGLVVMDEGEPQFVCPLCRYAWCRACQTPGHLGQTCAQMHGPGHQLAAATGKLVTKLRNLATRAPGQRSDRQFIRYLRKHKTILCPTCGHGLQKTEGNCNHIMCGVCKTHVCWLCSEKIPARTYDDATAHFWNKRSPCYGRVHD